MCAVGQGLARTREGVAQPAHHVFGHGVCRQRHLAQFGCVAHEGLCFVVLAEPSQVGVGKQARRQLVANGVERAVEGRRAVEEAEVVQEAEHEAEHQSAPDVADALLRRPAPEVAVPEGARLELVLGVVGVAARAPVVVDPRNDERADAEQARKRHAAHEGARRRAWKAFAVAAIAPSALVKLNRHPFEWRVDGGLVGAHLGQLLHRLLDREVLAHDWLNLARRKDVEHRNFHRIGPVLGLVIARVSAPQLRDVIVQGLGDRGVQKVRGGLHVLADVL